ncbi:MAG: hypothetical protein ACLTW6_13635 [Enterobacter sp.]
MPVNERIHPTSGTRLIRAGSDSSQLVKSPLQGNFTVTASLSSGVGTQESYLPFNLQPVDVAMSPNGEMWFREDTYSPDFSLEKLLDKKHLFMHEMMHVWQVILKGCLSEQEVILWYC